MKELTRTFTNAPKDVNRAYRKELRHVAQPVQVDAQGLAVSEIRRMSDSPDWARMRIGVTPKLVYVAPRKRGVKRGPLKRPNLARLLAERSLEPALERNRGRVERDFDQMLDRLVTKWDHDGP